MERLQTLKDMHQQEANRLEAAVDAPAMQESIGQHLEWLQASIKELTQRIDDHIDHHPQLRRDAELITSTPGAVRRLQSSWRNWATCAAFAVPGRRRPSLA